MIIIRTQDTTEVLQCHDIVLGNDYEKTLSNYSKSNKTELGCYYTQERAKEVMNEICIAIENGERFYSMPEE